MVCFKVLKTGKLKKFPAHPHHLPLL